MRDREWQQLLEDNNLIANYTSIEETQGANGVIPLLEWYIADINENRTTFEDFQDYNDDNNNAEGEDSDSDEEEAD